VGRAPAGVPAGGAVKEFFSRYLLAQLQNLGGPILKSPRLIPVFFDDDQSAP
jgi:hypothetical protein